MADVAVTGATGFVGRHVVSALLEAEHHVRTLTRLSPNATTLPTSVTIVTGDVRDAFPAAEAVRDAEVVVHLAGAVSDHPGAIEAHDAGTRSVVTAAREAGVKRIVFLSCLGADAANHSPYYRAKWRAEQYVRASGIPYVVLRSSLIVGSGDTVVTSLAELVRHWPVVPIAGNGDHRLQPIDVGDVARCVVRAVTDESVLNEEVALGGPEYLSFRNLVDVVAGEVGVVRRKVSIPGGWMTRTGNISHFPGAALFEEPRRSQFAQTSVVSPGIVQRHFGFEPRSIVTEVGRYLG